MTDRLVGFTVILERDMRDDEIKPLRNAVAQMRGVLRTEPIVTTLDGHAAASRERRLIAERLHELARTIDSGE